MSWPIWIRVLTRSYTPFFRITSVKLSAKSWTVETPRTLSWDLGTIEDQPYKAKLTAVVPTSKTVTTMTTRAPYSTSARRHALTETAAGTFSETRGKRISLPFQRQWCERTLTYIVTSAASLIINDIQVTCWFSSLWPYFSALTSEIWFNA